MNTQLQEIHDAQKASWDRFSPGWRKWDDLTMDFLVSQKDAIVDALELNPADYVLDVAGGTGEPALSIAGLVTDGKVVVSDISDGMLSVAREKAAEKGLRNFEIINADACDLPFEDQSFHKVSCRLGLMFVPDISLSIREMVRVLKPGGKFATTVWAAPDNNYWVTCMMENIKKYIEVIPPEPGSPGMFRCAAPGFIAGLCRDEGLSDVKEVFIKGRMATTSGEHYWRFMTEVAAPFVAALSNADPETVEKVHRDVVAAMDERYPNGGIDSLGILITGTR